MKSQQTDIVYSPSLDHEIISKKEVQKHVFECIKGNNAVVLCQNKNCTNNTFICQNQSCQCRLNHKKCLKTSVEQFFAEIQKKIYPTKNIKQKVDTIIDQAIDYISKVRDQIYLELKYLGLNYQQKQLMEMIQKQQTSQINGAKIWKVCQDIYQEKQISSTYILKQLNKYWNGYQKKFRKNIDKLKELSQKQCDLRAKLFKDSEILLTNVEIDSLSGLFNVDITETKLLYSAKKNDYCLIKYKINCQGHKNTLLVVKTKEGHVFGGFLDVQIPKIESFVALGGFGQTNYQEHKSQKSQKAFVFSLTNNDKFTLMNPNQAFTYKPTHGPQFGINFIGIYKTDPTRSTMQNPTPFNFGTPLLTTNNAFGGNNQDGQQDQNNPRPVNNEVNNTFNGFGGVNAGFGGFGGMGMPNMNRNNLGGFGTIHNPVLRTGNELANQKQSSTKHHYCTVLNGKAYKNQKYKSDNQSRFRFCGTSQKVFQIKQWQVFQLTFEQA